MERKNRELHRQLRPEDAFWGEEAGRRCVRHKVWCCLWAAGGCGSQPVVFIVGRPWPGCQLWATACGLLCGAWVGRCG